MAIDIGFPDDRPLDVIPLGRATLDINTKDVSYTFTDAPSLKHYVGGSPANTAIGLARLGARVGFIGKVSDDSVGRFIVATMQREGVDVSHLTRCAPGVCLGLAFTEAMENGQTDLVLYREGRVADLQLSADDISPDYIASARCLIVSGTALSASPSREAALEATRIARERGVPIVLDVDYRPQAWRSPRDAGLYAALVAQHAAVIMGSREEHDLLSNGPEDDAATAARAFGNGTALVIIKHGKQGSRAYSRDGESYQVNIVPVQALKSTGGGDAYSSALLYGLLSGEGLRRALELATASASMVIGAPSCSEAMPTRGEIDAFIGSSALGMDQVVQPL